MSNMPGVSLASSSISIFRASVRCSSLSLAAMASLSWPLSSDSISSSLYLAGSYGGVSASTTSRNVILDAGGDPFAHLRRDLAQRLGAERRAARDGREALRGAGERREAWERRAARKEARERARARLRAEGRRCGHAEREQELLHRAYGTWCSGRLRTFSAKELVLPGLQPL